MTEVSPTLAIWVGLAALPLLLTLATAFTKSLVVLGALRVGLSAESLLPWPALLAVATVTTAVIMLPTASSIWTVVEAAGGVDALADAEPSVWLSVADPLLSFVQQHASDAEVGFFSELTGRAGADPFAVIPAFLVTELTEAFTMAIVILVPLVLVDLIVAQTLVLLNLANQPTAIVTAPLKLLLFLAVGGWDIVIGGLVKGYS